MLKSAGIGTTLVLYLLWARQLQIVFPDTFKPVRVQIARTDIAASPSLGMENRFIALVSTPVIHSLQFTKSVLMPKTSAI